MRSVALAIGWELWGRNRWGIAAVLGVTLAVSAVSFVLPRETAREPILALSVILFAVGFLYLLSVVLYSELREGTLLSGFPARLFTLPVRTSVLVAWPMVYGAAALVLLWAAMALLVWLPAGIEQEWWVLPLLVVALVWFQAVCWAVPGSPLAKILALCVVFPALKMLLALAVAWFVNPQSRLDRNALLDGRVLTLALFCGGCLPLAYGVAVWGVARDRRGAYQGRLRLGRLIELALGWLPKRRGRFASAARAQLWFEWRRKGLLLPLFAACFLLFVTVVVAPHVPAVGLLYVLAILLGLWCRSWPSWWAT